MISIIKYRITILSKLKDLKKKFTLVYQVSKDSEKMSEIYRYIMQLEDMMRKLEQNTLTWENIETIGISKNSILEDFSAIEEFSSHNSYEFSFLNEISTILFVPYNNQSNFEDINFINALYTIIEYINTNYQPIFTQRILLSASKTNNIREHFYMQYQEIIHIFKSYKNFTSIPNNSNEHEQLIRKEYIQLIKAIYYFFVGIQKYIDNIKKDPTFIPEDYQQIIKSTDKTISIYNISLGSALEECSVFVNEALGYLKDANNDIINLL